MLSTATALYTDRYKSPPDRADPGLCLSVHSYADPYQTVVCSTVAEDIVVDATKLSTHVPETELLDPITASDHLI